MSKKKKSAPLKDDFTVSEDEDIFCFKENYKPEGRRVSLFSFNSPKTSGQECQNSTSDNSNNTDIKPSDSPIEATAPSQDIDSAHSNDSPDSDNENDTDTSAASEISVQNENSTSDTHINLLANLLTKSTFGSIPAIDGEPADLRRSYNLRRSTIKKIDEIKNAHPEACVCVSTVVDIAIAHYYDCIFGK